MDEIKNMKIYSDRTFYRLKADLKTILGVDHRAHHSIDFKVINPSIDYRDYISENYMHLAIFNNDNITIHQY